ncbi:MAG TPA: type II toxin-antitoxin system RelE/ParE family toxin [Bacillota bacterium]|nr:type II toxin-antitoxin system RelE/ParE family toxin [Bacillota bacterium]
MTYQLLPPAARYYEEKVPGLGVEFIAEVRSTIRRILAHPEAWCLLDPEFRRCRTARFPYGIIYTIEGDYILIVSVMHLHQHPDTWKENL